MEPAFYCGKKCFTAEWKTHNEAHKIERARAAFQPPPFIYKGPLRPYYVTPQRTVPDHIQKPDYHLSGQPTSEMKLRGSNRIIINTPEQIAGIREACRLGREILDLAGQMVAPGVTCEAIDLMVHNEIIARNAYPSPLNYHNFPKSCCTSVNEVVCHGIPDMRPLEDGDIVNIDITVYKDGFHGDLNETFLVGTVAPEHKKLVKASYDSMMLAIAAVAPGVACRDFGTIINKHITKCGFSVVKTYCGHGIGELFHSAPNIPHYQRNKAVGICAPGMVFTIEPMINQGTFGDETWPDNWTAVTKDGKRSAQFEHTMLVTEDGVEILTARTENSVPFFWEADDYVEESLPEEEKVTPVSQPEKVQPEQKKKKNRRRRR
jgi:methionyl aminopeptidase